MLDTLMAVLSLCWKPRSVDNDGNPAWLEALEDHLWHRDIEMCAGGEFSMAVIQANEVLEDQSQIESGDFGTFVGVYDGHGGPHAARYVSDHLFNNFKELLSRPAGVTPDIIKRAFMATEEGFSAVVSQLWSTRPDIATMGTCCLVGIISEGTLHVANLGDSRIVLGREVGNRGKITAIQLSTEHNANIEAVREELKSEHPNDPEIVVLRLGVWRVKGIIQVSRSIGDVYLKDAQYNREPINMNYIIPEPKGMPVLNANPTIISHPLQPGDLFLIFASDGLWEQLSNEQAVKIVRRHPRAGIAKRLIDAALLKAAKKHEALVVDVLKLDKKARRHFHDDITVVVIFLTPPGAASGPTAQAPSLSIRSALNLEPNP